ncbi:MAG TPA: HRDC domain-containing protein, partial [Thermoanaerobaculia bacterium]|nr:HRDC domain-containing protein [Thermoanaerobaculia bacterium]
IDQTEDSGESNPGDLRHDLDREKLARVIAYADSTGCHRATILGYFGERGTGGPCGFCGNCARRRELSEDDLLRLRKILSGVARGGERWGKRRIVAMLTGELEGLPDALAGLSTTGILAAEGPRVVADWIDAAQGGGLLAASRDGFRTLSLTRAGRDVMAGRATQISLTVPEPPPPKPRRVRASKSLLAAAPESADPHRVEVLREWRRQEAARRAVPAYVVFHDRTLVALAAARPATLDALSAIPGIGPAKLEAYGEDLLALFASERG